MIESPKPRILYILPGLVPPPENPAFDKFSYLSKIASGDVLLPVWLKSADEAPSFLRGTFPEHQIGGFRYHLFPAYKYPTLLRRYARLVFYVKKGWSLYRDRRFDIVVAYGSNAPGTAGAILKWITGAKYILEIPGVPENAFRFDYPNAGIGAGLKRTLANVLLRTVGASADCFKLLYPEQLRNFPKLRKKRAAVFHNFVPVSTIPPSIAGDCPYVLLVGYPWYTKGFDILIRAFRMIANRYPEWKLKLMGFCPDRAPLEKLADGCPQIEFVPAGPNEVALKHIAGCSVLVLPSRTEAMGRVLLEAMAAGKPIIASRVGGIPHYITHGGNGLLVEPENVSELAAALERILSSPELAKSLAENGQKRVFAELDEHAYVRAFEKMLEALQKEPGEFHSKHSVDGSRELEPTVSG